MSNPSDVERLSSDAEQSARHDAELVSSVLAGNPGRYDELVRRYQRRAVAVAYRLLGDIHDAADVAQDAFLRAYKSLATLQDRRRFGPWLMRIVSNLSLNYRRSRQAGPVRRAVSLDDAPEGSDPLRSATGQAPAGRTSPADTSVSNELQAAIDRGLDRLPEKQRLALVLFSMEGVPQKEVAQILDCTIELVKWNVFQARKALRKELADYLI
ncbi:MAG: RNA polymerase sigma factor [Phycisphaerae bacterium]